LSKGHALCQARNDICFLSFIPTIRSLPELRRFIPVPDGTGSWSLSRSVYMNVTYHRFWLTQNPRKNDNILLFNNRLCQWLKKTRTRRVFL